MSTLRTGILLLLAAATAAATDYFPLQAGNQWTYRDAASGATLEIRVGVPVMHQGNPYYKVTGYAASPVFLRSEGGNLYGFDEEADREYPFATFEPVDGGWFDTSIAGCPQGAQPQAKTVPFSAPNAWFSESLEVLYRSYSCADTGIERELYVANLGLARRGVTTFAGPVVYELVHARVGALTYAGEPEAGFRVAVDRTVVDLAAGDNQRLRVTLRLSLQHSPALMLAFPSAQRYDIQLRDAAGEVVYRWSDDVAYAQSTGAIVAAGEAVFVQEIPLHARGGAPLAQGAYTVEAWLATPAREFASAVGIEVRSFTGRVAGARSLPARPGPDRLR